MKHRKKVLTWAIAIGSESFWFVLVQENKNGPWKIDTIGNG